MIGIYKIINPKGKIYIGQSINIEKRFKHYKNLHCKNQKKIYNSFLKYGVDNHKFEIVVECEINQLNELERYYQELYFCIGENGLNCSYVNTENKKSLMSDESKLKISIANKGRKRTQEFKDLMKTQKKNISEETKQKMRDAWSKRVLTDEHKEKIRINKFGVIPKMYNVVNIESGIFSENIKKASDEYGYTYGNLKAMLYGKVKNRTQLILIKRNNNFKNR